MRIVKALHQRNQAVACELDAAQRRESQLQSENETLLSTASTARDTLRDLEQSIQRASAQLRATRQHEDLLRSQVDIRQQALEASRLRVLALEQEVWLCVAVCVCVCVRARTRMRISSQHNVGLGFARRTSDPASRARSC